jgi:hypothetical protein
VVVVALGVVRGGSDVVGATDDPAPSPDRPVLVVFGDVVELAEEVEVVLDVAVDVVTSGTALTTTATPALHAYSTTIGQDSNFDGRTSRSAAAIQSRSAAAPTSPGDAIATSSCSATGSAGPTKAHVRFGLDREMDGAAS